MNPIADPNTMAVNELLLGAIVIMCLIAGLFFFRYWLSTRDRFFVFFAVSFWVEGANRLHMGLTFAWNEEQPVHYLVRILCYGLILFAIWDKNRPGRP